MMKNIEVDYNKYKRNMDSVKVRLDTHAGSWYSDNPQILDKQMNTYLSKAKIIVPENSKIKAIIGPHAGFDYSAPTAAWAYQHLNPTQNLRVFLLGPCHHTYIKGFGLSELDFYRTPLGDITLDKESKKDVQIIILAIKKIASETKGFIFTKKNVEEDEHSLELHLPYIQKLLKDQPFKLVPIMVGATDPSFEAYLGKYLAQYFDDPNTIFIISSDFCHWGKRFQFTYYKPEDGEIHESIEQLDKQGISLIEKHDTNGYNNYLSETENTICGRHPIGVLLNIINNSTHKAKLKTQLAQYAQSSAVKHKNDSSVSYASLVTYLQV